MIVLDKYSEPVSSVFGSDGFWHYIIGVDSLGQRTQINLGTSNEQYGTMMIGDTFYYTE